MNIFDDMPDIPACPKCGHDGEGLNWAFPDKPFTGATVMASCLACGFHGRAMLSYAAAIEAFTAGESEVA